MCEVKTNEVIVKQKGSLYRPAACYWQNSKSWNHESFLNLPYWKNFRPKCPRFDLGKFNGTLFAFFLVFQDHFCHIHYKNHQVATPGGQLTSDLNSGGLGVIVPMPIQCFSYSVRLFFPKEEEQLRVNKQLTSRKLLIFYSEQFCSVPARPYLKAWPSL